MGEADITLHLPPRRWTCTPAPSPSSSCCTPSSRPKSPAWGCWHRCPSLLALSQTSWGSQKAPQPLLPNQCLAGAGIAALRVGSEPLLPHTSAPGPPSAPGDRGTHTSFNPPGAEAITDLTACALQWGQLGPPTWGTPGAPNSRPGEPVSPCLGASPKEVTLSPHGTGLGL